MLEIFENIEDDENEGNELPKEYEVDFDSMALTGKIVEGVDALAVWCFFALKTARYRYRAYTWEYGSEIETIIGKGYGVDYTKSEIERFISDCLICHPYISGIENTEMKFESDGNLLVTFTLVTDFGNKEMTFEMEGE